MTKASPFCPNPVCEVAVVMGVFCADVGRAHPPSDFPLVCIVFVDEAVDRADRWMFWTCVLAFRFLEPGECRDAIQRALTIHSRDLRDAVKKKVWLSVSLCSDLFRACLAFHLRFFVQ